MLCPLAGIQESNTEYPVGGHNFQSKITLFNKLNFKRVAAKVVTDGSKKGISNDP